MDIMIVVKLQQQLQIATANHNNTSQVNSEYLENQSAVSNII